MFELNVMYVGGEDGGVAEKEAAKPGITVWVCVWTVSVKLLYIFYGAPGMLLMTK